MADEKQENARILEAIGEVLREDLMGLTDNPPPRAILLQVLHLIRREQERWKDHEPMSWEDLPDDLRQLLDRLKASDGS